VPSTSPDPSLVRRGAVLRLLCTLNTHSTGSGLRSPMTAPYSAPRPSRGLQPARIPKCLSSHRLSAGWRLFAHRRINSSGRVRAAGASPWSAGQSHGRKPLVLSSRSSYGFRFVPLTADFASPVATSLDLSRVKKGPADSVTALSSPPLALWTLDRRRRAGSGQRTAEPA